MQRQEQDNWCWAATSASIDAFYNPSTTVSQCGLANTVHGQTTCCADGSTSQRNKAAITGDVLSMIGRLSSQTEQAEPFDVVDKEIATNRRPLGARIKWSGDGRYTERIGLITLESVLCGKSRPKRQIGVLYRIVRPIYPLQDLMRKLPAY